MGAVIILTPILIGAWPAISAAVAGAAASLGFAVAAGKQSQRESSPQQATNKIETELPHSEIFQDSAGQAETISIVKDGVTIEFKRDLRGTCSMCVTGSKSKQELQKIGQEVSGRVVQQFAYHKLVTELKKRNYAIVDEKVQQDESIRVRVRFGG